MRCIAYIIKVCIDIRSLLSLLISRFYQARRKLINGGFSTSETLVLPLLDGFDKFELSLIEINQNKVEYIEGEFIEAIIHNFTGRNFNYAVKVDINLLKKSI